jgi:TRAP-type transport system periplasmic protein
LTEALIALQTGTIDAVYGGLTVFAGLKYYDTAKYVLETEWAYALAITYVSKSWFDRLDPALQTIVTEEAKAIEPELLTWVLAQQDRAKATWKSNGGEITVLSPADRANMMKTVEAAGEEVMASQPALKDAYATIKARILAVK